MVSKRKVKTLDGLLEEALVPEEEQPYELPNNWVWIKFKDVFCTVSNSNAAVKLKDYLDTGKYPVIDQSSRLIGGYTNEDLKYTGELPIIVFGDHTKNIKWIDFDFVQGADGTKLLTTLLPFNKYYYYLLKNINLPDKGYSRHFKYLKENVFPIAPLDEQIRIVRRIEKMLSKIEKAQQLIEEAKEKTLLEKAIYFRDTLAGKDLSNNEQWKVLKIEDLIMPTRRSMTTGPFGTSLKKADYVSKGIPVLGIDNINNGEFVYENKNFITEDKLKELTSFLVEKDDVIISRSGTVGELCIVPKKIPPAIISTNIIKLTLNKEIILPQFFVYMFLVEGIVKEQIRDLCKGSTREFLNQTILKSIEFPVPSIAEQEIIIEKMKDAINRFNKTEDFINEKSLGLDKLKSSILSKAFKGELGTSDPNDEPAIELLKWILQKKL